MITLQARIIKEEQDTFTLIKKFKNVGEIHAYVAELFKSYGHYGKRYYSLGFDPTDINKFLVDIKISKKEVI